MKFCLENVIQLRRAKAATAPLQNVPQRKRPRDSSPDTLEMEVEAGRAPGTESETRATQVSPGLAAGAAPAVAGTAPPVAETVVSTPRSIPTKDGEWKKHLSKKERRRRRKAEAASKKEAASATTAPAVPTQAGGARGNSSAPRKPRPRKPRTEAILIKPSGGRSFAEVLGNLKTKAKPEESGTVVKSIRRTQNGDVLLELGKPGDKAGFAAKLKAALGETGTVRALDPKVSVEVRDLDGLSTETEVAEAIKRALPEFEEGEAAPKLWLTKPNRSEQRMAVVQLGEKAANKLLSLQHLRVGWVSCRVRRRVEVPRCFRCLGFGHSSRNCKGPDRGKNCLRCGDVGHEKKGCQAAVSCFLCKEKGVTGGSLKHTPGTGQCGTFKAALEQAKARTSR